MLAATIIAGLIAALIAIWRSGPERAVLNVFLPVMMLWQYGSGWRFRGVEIDVFETVSVVIAISLFVKYRRRWQYSFVDLLMVCYCFAVLLSNWNADGQSAGLALSTATAISCIPPYIVGKAAVERPGLRLAFMKRFAFLAFLVALASVYEYRMEQNPFRQYWDRAYHMTSEGTMQLRWGFARISGPYGHAILADCIMLCALIFALWLAFEGQWGKRFRRLEFLPGKKSVYILLGLALGVWMTQSRGPWMGGAFGILLVLAARAKNQKRALRNVFVVSIVLFAVFYTVLNKYTDVNHAPSDQDQENAQYRRMLITNYIPVAERGGLLGWGLHFPKVDGQISIDNEYLIQALETGYLGLAVFLLIIIATAGRLVRCALASKDRSEIAFHLCLLGAFLTIVLSITTVYLGYQTYTLFFILAGWTEELRPVKARALAAQSVPIHPPVRFAFRRVWS